MSYDAKVIEVLIASPSDISTERHLAREAVHEWHSIHAKDRKTILIPRMWEHDSAPEVGVRPQEIINRQLLQDADLLIAVFWTRIGSPTGKSASGTVEEIEEHIKTGKTAMLYFSSTPVVPDELDPVQYEELKKCKIWARQQSLYHDYSSPEAFGQTVRRHLAQQIIEKFQPDKNRNLEEEQPTSVQTGSSLTAEAQELLVAAAGGKDGAILVFGALDGWHVEAKGKNFTELQNARSEALWQAAVRELAGATLIEDRSGKGKVKVYSLTGSGFTTADRILAERGKLESQRSFPVSREARELLAEAAASSDKRIAFIRSANGLIITTKTRQFAAPPDERSVARWKSAADELTRAGFVEDRHGNGKFLNVAEAGYQYLESVAAKGTADVPSPSNSDIEPLAAFGEHEALTLHELAESLEVKEQKAQFHLDRLQSRGYVEEYQPAANGEFPRYALTPTGRAMLVELELL